MNRYPKLHQVGGSSGHTLERWVEPLSNQEPLPPNHLEFHAVVQLAGNWSELNLFKFFPLVVYYIDLDPSYFTPQLLSDRFSCKLIQVTADHNEAILLARQLQQISDVLDH